MATATITRKAKTAQEIRDPRPVAPSKHDIALDKLENERYEYGIDESGTLGRW